MNNVTFILINKSQVLCALVYTQEASLPLRHVVNEMQASSQIFIIDASIFGSLGRAVSDLSLSLSPLPLHTFFFS